MKSIIIFSIICSIISSISFLVNMKFYTMFRGQEISLQFLQVGEYSFYSMVGFVALASMLALYKIRKEFGPQWY